MLWDPPAGGEAGVKLLPTVPAQGGAEANNRNSSEQTQLRQYPRGSNGRSTSLLRGPIRHPWASTSQFLCHDTQVLT